MAARRAAPDLDLRADSDRLLCVVPALSFAWHDGFQLLSLLVAHAHDRAVAVRAVLVSVGAAGVRSHRCRDLVDVAADPCWFRPIDPLAAPAPDRGLCRVFDPVGRDLSADASGVRRRRLVRTRPLSVSDPDQPYPAIPGLLLCRSRHRRRQPEDGSARGTGGYRSALAC